MAVGLHGANRPAFPCALSTITVRLWPLVRATLNAWLSHGRSALPVPQPAPTFFHFLSPALGRASQTSLGLASADCSRYLNLPTTSEVVGAARQALSGVLCVGDPDQDWLLTLPNLLGSQPTEGWAV